MIGHIEGETTPCAGCKYDRVSFKRFILGLELYERRTQSHRLGDYWSDGDGFTFSEVIGGRIDCLDIPPAGEATPA
jgi:hypothetical protein